MFHKITRFALVAAVAFSSLALLPATSRAGVTQYADNYQEYRAYVYTYSGRSMLYGLPYAIENEMASGVSVAQWNQLNTELLWTTTVRNQTTAALKHAHQALSQNDNNQWQNCTEDLVSALDGCELLLLFYDSIDNPNQSRVNAVRSAIFYLEIAVQNSAEAYLIGVANQGNRVPRP